MKFLNTILVSFLITSQALAGLPPTTAKGQGGSSSVSFETQAPFSQITKTDSVKALVETGNANIIANPGFEASSSATGWTSSGGTYTLTTTAANVGSGVNAASWDSSAASQTLTSTAVAIPAGDYGANYEVSANLECGTGTCTHTIQAFDGTNIVASQTITSSLTYVRSTLNFVAPSSGNLSARIVSVASNEPILYVDDVYLGRARNIGLAPVIQGWKNDLTWTVNGAGTITGSNFWYKRDGDTMRVRGSFTVGTPTASPFYIQLPSGYTIDTSKLSNSSNAQGLGTGEVVAGTNSLYISGIGLVPFYDGSTNNQVFLGYRASANASIEKPNGNNVVSSGHGVSFNFDIPITGWGSELAVRPDLLANSWSGYHDTDCSWTTTSSTYADPANDASCTFTQKTNSNFGTVTTAGASTTGIVWTPKKTGNYYVCTDTTFRNTVSTATLGAQLTDGSTVIAGPSLQNSSVNGADQGLSFCGIYNVNSLSSVTLKLQFKINTGTLTVNGTNGTRTSWTIFAIDQSLPAPVLVGSVTSKYAGAGVSGWVSFGGASERSQCTSTPCTIYDQSGTTTNFISSITRASTGDYTINFVSGVFTRAPYLICYDAQGNSNTSFMTTNGSAPTTTAFGLIFSNYNVPGNRDTQADCLILGR